MSARVTSELAAEWIRSTYHVKITAATIRQWARRGWITSPEYRHGQYDLWEVEAVARRRKLIP